MIGVPLAIVDKEKVLALVEKLFGAEDTEAEFEFEVGPVTADGNRRMRLEIKSLVRKEFANGVLAGGEPEYWTATTHKAPQEAAKPAASAPTKKKR